MSDTPRTDYFYANRLGMAEHGFPSPMKFAQQLERELASALARLADIEAGTIHTCHDHCQRPECVLRRERDDARRDYDLAVAELAEVVKERDALARRILENPR